MKKKYPPYTGIIDRQSKNIDPDVLRAATSYHSQRLRCYAKNHNRYQYVGAKGIEVEYPLREFVTWWLENLRKKRWKHPACGRLDHDKNYCFENIAMQERAENTREMNRRRDGNKNYVNIVAEGPSKLRLVFSTVAEAARVTGAPRSLLEAHLSGKIESPVPQLVFRYTLKSRQARAER